MIRFPRRWPARVMLAATVLSLIVYGLSNHYLNPGRIASHLAGRLQAAYGAAVTVEGAEVQWQRSSLQSVRLFETEAIPGSEPWVELDGLGSDVSLWSLLFGELNPHHVNVDRARIVLRLDERGDFLSRLPSPAQSAGSLPSCTVRQGQFILRQAGRPDFVLNAVRAEFERNGRVLRLRGSIDDPTWGEWQLAGSWDAESATGTLLLESPRRHVTQAMLEKLPVVPPKVWKHVACEGDTPVRLELRFAPKTGHRIQYSVDLQPENTRVYISSIDLKATEASGHVRIVDNVVFLEGVRGRTAGGELLTEASLDYSRRPYELDFVLRADNLRLRELPRSWSFVRDLPFDGNLAGIAKLTVRLPQEKSILSGTGRGSVRDIRLAGIPLGRSLPIRLRVDGSRLRFSTAE